MEPVWKEYTRLQKHLEKLEPGTDEYSKTLKQFNDLVYIVKQFPLHAAESRLDKFMNNSALIGLVGNLAITLLILNYERAEIVTSRVFSFVRPK